MGKSLCLFYSQTPNAEQKIASFRRSNKRLIVSVAMISEGVDIKRLRVLLYLPNSQTEPHFGKQLAVWFGLVIKRYV